MDGGTQKERKTRKVRELRRARKRKCRMQRTWTVCDIREKRKPLSGREMRNEDVQCKQKTVKAREERAAGETDGEKEKKGKQK